jgi:hypothetical protein
MMCIYIFSQLPKTALGFINAFFNLPGRKKLNGVYTPEQLFTCADILPFGNYDGYSLEKRIT